MALTGAERQARYRSTGRHRQVLRDYRRRHPGRDYAALKERRRKEPEKETARQAVKRAVRRGELERGPCEHASGECSGRVQAHHDDYAKPLVVRWLCPLHHAAEHRATIAGVSV